MPRRPKIPWWDYDRHPVWRFGRFVVALAALVVIFKITATSFDADELVQIAYYVGAVGGGSLASRPVAARLLRRFAEKEHDART